MAIMIIAVYTVIGIIDIPHLLRKKLCKELFVYLAFFLTSFVISLLYVIGINILSPNTAISNLIRGIEKIVS